VDFIKVVLTVVVAVVVVAAVLSTAVLTVANRMLGESNRSLLTTYVTEQANLAAAGVEQEKFALYLATIDSQLCQNMVLIDSKLGIVGIPCEPLPNFGPLPGTKPKTTK
jgi:hypothetical protein